ncbi:MAG: SDR family NAD(P)-dependent oxidoreductase [Flavobacteriales bacterium]|nr:SDR family NAD(P)-dependent oxidoreductase [Flavobacteriales bacterium]
MSADRRVLVTGGAGFIGSHVCERLIASGWKVRCMDDLTTGHRSNIQALEGGHFSFVEADIRDASALRAALEGIDRVVHLAALGSVPRSIADPLASESVNLTGTLQLFTEARAAGVERVVYASSSSVYGDSASLPKREGEEGRPLSPYAVTKAMNEAYALLHHRLFDLRTIGLRFFNVFGERQDPAGPYAAAIPRFVEALFAHRPPKVHGDGAQTRDFTYVKNAAQAVERALTTDDDRAFGSVFNIAYGERTDLLQLIALIRELAAQLDPAIATIGVEHGPPRSGDVQDSLADITRAREVLGFDPDHDLRQGLERALQWYRLLQA